MDGIFHPNLPASQNVAGLIRCENNGMCSGEPAGIRYTGVLGVEEVLARIGITGDDLMTEDQWHAACDIVCR